MQQGFFIAGIAGVTAQQQLNVVSQNLANVNTDGYRADRASFSTFFANQNGQTGQMPAAYLSDGSHYIDPAKGTFRKTDNDLDIAIEGDAYFRIRLDDGSEAYSSAGNMHMDADGNLLNNSNHPVLDSNGQPINLPPGRLEVAEDGGMKVGEIHAAQLGLVQIIDFRKVQKLNGALLKTAASNTKPADSNVQIQQGMLEGSNVNAVLAMTKMISITRNYQTMMKIVEQYNRLASQLNDRVGMTRG